MVAQTYNSSTQEIRQEDSKFREERKGEKKGLVDRKGMGLLSSEQ